MARAFIGVGSNIEPAENVKKALRLLASQVNIVAISNVYSTEAEGRPDQPSSYNCVVEIETDIPPEELKQTVLRKVESELGRKRTKDKFAPRTIDLDLILYGDLVLNTGDLVLPDPQIATRPFLARPLFELEPNLIMPGVGLSLKKVVAQLKSVKMEPLKQYSGLLKKEILHGKRD
jgi:2-amino-4-hydroxy-6-hydroxymethyldihydropteridine diphosphokinase